MKLSVCIPYKNRLDNLALALEGLAAQSLPTTDFEVVVAAMEYEPAYVELCRRFIDRLDIVTVMSARDFHIPHARNLAMSATRGEVVVQMDADTLLPPDALENLWNHHFGFQQEVCVVGQVVGYGNNEDGDVTSVELRPYGDHLEALTDMTRGCTWPDDPRFQGPHSIPWALAWTGLIALPRARVIEDGLWFDESFRGWGVDDLEWGYRVARSRLAIVLAPDVYALHLPHVRDSEANRKTESGNYARFLAKWPEPDVELARSLGDLRANEYWWEYRSLLREASGADRFVSVRGRIAGEDVLQLGVAADSSNRVTHPDRLVGFDDPSSLTVLPLTGMSLPFDDGQIDRCVVGEGLRDLTAELYELVLAEAARVAVQVVDGPGPRQ